MKSAETPIHEFQEDCFKVLQAMPNDDTRLTFLNQLFGLAMLYGDVPKNLNTIRLTLAQQNFQNFPTLKYFGIPLYSISKDEVVIHKYALFPEETGLFDKEGKLICLRSPEQAMQHFITSVNLFLEANIHKLKDEEKTRPRKKMNKKMRPKVVQNITNYFNKSDQAKEILELFCKGKTVIRIEIAAETLKRVVNKKHGKIIKAPELCRLFIEIGVLSKADFKNYSDRLRRLKSKSIELDNDLFDKLSSLN